MSLASERIKCHMTPSLAATVLASPKAINGVDHDEHAQSMNM